MRSGVADLREVAVARETDVVELDLVEARLRGGHGHVQVVGPDASVVGVRPAEARVVVPEGAVGVADCKGRPLLGEHRVLERDDAADQVDAVRMDDARHPP